MSLQVVKDLLQKHKLVESMLHNQPMPRHDLVETLVQKQHLTALRKHLESLIPAEIAVILEELPLEDARLILDQVDKEREADVLWEVTTTLREKLIGTQELHSGRGHLNAFQLVNGRLSQMAINGREDMESIRPIWIDLLGASKAERGMVGQYYGVELPNPDESTDLEASARYFLGENDEVFLFSDFLLDREGESRGVPVSFVLHKDILFTVRNEELPVFRLQRLRARTQPGYVSDCKDVLLDLYSADVEYSADALEDVYATLDKVGKTVLRQAMSDQEAARTLADIAEEENLNGRIRRNILDTQRAVSFLVRGKFLLANQLDDARQIVRDIESLNSHTSFLFDKINFLMDATVGFININQNQVVKQLTVLSVVFMPLNIIAGMGGMSEFSTWTQGISWPISYGVFTVGMVGVAWLTFLILRFFEKRRLQRRINANAINEAA
ncbi:MAG: magnesium transporter CorA [Hydrogenophilales bacterium CG03_land_8_20_14_0_80_62_28]|nr:MAG: magnesium transporter CorA [Hydrogenophilaceae bacterium CG1_02_62_390]PIV22298.1 MAG: magnesium transporter CorA [Hydrogenophilales bacterium CG03_land_8_20_14_0_80_62_28]PIW38398.1 MAG: magnesium transporter CorA [Hydrogenophilales bacterium CG15_BIG_FIL_POST_REV_8_21_14_020_62_31]PIW72108.1 MAG: magnesium transporter CorA [Hydrogenophilales bacterium CG12_big_fil_rev_8_21_14_0_65_61_21]PIY98246.1 MAG: magnesium transporter CorA [Hydrogenophilales bacterium CG_4_10_14_0_8_um_filter_62